MGGAPVSRNQVGNDAVVLKKAWPRVQPFFDAVTALIREVNGPERTTKALAKLEVQYGRNIVTRFSRLPRSVGHDFWPIKRVFGKALPSLHTTPADLLRCLIALQDASKGDMAATWILTDLQEMARKQPKFAEQFIEHISRHSASGAPFLSALLAGLSARRFAAAFGMAERGITSNAKPIRQASIHAMGRLAYGNHKAKARIACHRLAAIANNAADDHATTAVVALGLLLNHLSDDAGQVLCSIAASGPPVVRVGVPFALSFARNCHNESWFRRALLALTDLDAKDLPEGNWLDSVLSENCRRNDPLCLDFLNDWLRQHPDANVSTAFKSTISELGSLTHADWLASRLPAWFTHRRNVASWRLADALLKSYARGANPDEIPALPYAAEALNQLSVSDIHFLIRKTIGYTFVYPRLLCSTVFSCLSRRRDRKQVDSLVFSYFTKIIGRNYIGSTEALLKPLSQSGLSRQRRVAGDILKNLQAYYKSLQALPQLPEARPSTERWAAYSKMRSETFNKSAKKAGEKSILKAIATTVPLKYGSKFMFRFDGPGAVGKQRISEPALLVKHQLTYEFPRMISIDPVGLEFILSVYRGESEVSV